MFYLTSIKECWIEQRKKKNVLSSIAAHTEFGEKSGQNQYSAAQCGHAKNHSNIWNFGSSPSLHVKKRYFRVAVRSTRYNWFPLAFAHFVIHIHDFCFLFNTKCLFDINPNELYLLRQRQVDEEKWNNRMSFIEDLDWLMKTDAVEWRVRNWVAHAMLCSLNSSLHHFLRCSSTMYALRCMCF